MIVRLWTDELFCAQAFINLHAVVADLQLLVPAGYSEGVVYGSAQWFSYRRNIGAQAGWGLNPKDATYYWRRLTGISDMAWPGQQVHPTANASLTSTRERQPLVTGKWHREGLGLPYPFVRGGLMVYGRAIAEFLTESEHSMREHSVAEMVARTKGRPILHDVFLAHVLASARRGLGAHDVTLVNLGPDEYGQCEPPPPSIRLSSRLGPLPYELFEAIPPNQPLEWTHQMPMIIQA